MDTHTGEQQRFPAAIIVVVLFMLCIIVGQFWITKLYPSISGLVQINPIVVFLDIPVHLPVTIDIIVAPCLFLLMYPVVIFFYPSQRRRTLQRVKAAFTGLFILLCCMLLGGLIYYLVQDYLPVQVRNGINAMGINADIHLAYPGHETIYLRGSLILLLCFVMGSFIFIRKITREPKGQLTREQRMTPYQRMLKEKQLMQKIQKEEYKADKSRQPAYTEPQTIQPNRNGQSHLCWNQPVIAIKPEAVYYMPA
jgi:hypothetical protein